MKPSKYIKLAIKTENQYFEDISYRMDDRRFIRLDHASKGMITEVGEFVDVLKKYEIYGKPYSTIDLIEELGDLMWYIALACDEIGVSLEEVMEKNIAKLKVRYGEKFNEEDAINRDLDNERRILEKQEVIHISIAGGTKSICGNFEGNFVYSKQLANCKSCIEGYDKNE